MLYASLVVTSCEWRTIGLADPQALADEVFAILERRPDSDLHDLYEAVERVAMAAFTRHADQVGLMERVVQLGRFRPPEEVRELLAALSRLRQADRDLLQRRHWDSLDLLELAESLKASPEQTRERLVRAEQRFLAKARRSSPALTHDDVPRLVCSIKPGEHSRYPRR